MPDDDSIKLYAVLVFGVTSGLLLLVLLASKRGSSARSQLPRDAAPPQNMAGVGTTPNKRTAPQWYRPAGIVALIVGTVGFVASANTAGGGNAEGAIVAGLLNPAFFIGLLLAIYWLWAASKAPSAPRASKAADVRQENPKLMLLPPIVMARGVTLSGELPALRQTAISAKLVDSADGPPAPPL